MSGSDRVWLKSMELGGRLGCHQMPERSFFLRGYQFPLCARCTGVLLSSSAACAVYWLYKIPLAAAVLMSLVMLLDWGIQRLGIRESTNPRRLISGLIGGYGFMTLQLYAYVYLIKAAISVLR